MDPSLEDSIDECRSVIDAFEINKTMQGIRPQAIQKLQQKLDGMRERRGALERQRRLGRDVRLADDETVALLEKKVEGLKTAVAGKSDPAAREELALAEDRLVTAQIRALERDMAITQGAIDSLLRE